MIDDDVTFYKSNAFLVSTMTAIAGGAILDTAESSGIEILKKIVDGHEKLLSFQLKDEPLCKIVNLIKDAQEIIKKRKGISLEKSPVYFKHHLPSEHGLGLEKNYASERQAIYYAQSDFNDVWDAFRDSASDIETLRTLYERYIPVAAGLLLITWLKNSPDSEKIPALLWCIGALIKLDQMKLYALFRSEAFEDHAAQRKGKRHSDKQLEAIKQLENKLKETAYDLWKNKKDQRWHSTMARDLVEILNKPIIEKIKTDLSHKYPSHETEENDKKKYQKEYKNNVKYKTLSVNRAIEILYDVASEFKKNRGKRKNNNGTDLPNNFFDNFIPPTDFFIPIDEND